MAVCDVGHFLVVRPTGGEVEVTPDLGTVVVEDDDDVVLVIREQVVCVLTQAA